MANLPFSTPCAVSLHSFFLFQWFVDFRVTFSWRLRLRAAKIQSSRSAQMERTHGAQIRKQGMKKKSHKKITWPNISVFSHVPVWQISIIGFFFSLAHKYKAWASRFFRPIHIYTIHQHHSRHHTRGQTLLVAPRVPYLRGFLSPLFVVVGLAAELSSEDSSLSILASK